MCFLGVAYPPNIFLWLNVHECEHSSHLTIKICLALNSYKLFMISVIIMFSLRIWIGGTHRKSLMGCLIQSEVMFITIICVNNIIHISAIEQTIIMLIIITVDIACCPVIDGRRGKYSHRKIMKFKIYSVMAIILLNITAFMCARYEELLVACELVQLIEIVTSKLLLGNCETRDARSQS